MRVLLLAPCVITSVAFADETPIARPTKAEALDHLAKGNKLYKVRDWLGAAAEYKAGAVIQEAPIFDYNLGQCYRQAGEFEASIWHYTRFLKADSRPGPRTDAVRGFIEEMKTAQAAKASASEAPPTTIESAPHPADKVVAPIEVIKQPEVEPWHHDWFGWGLSGAGLVAGGVGLGFVLSAGSLRDDAKSEPDQSQARQLNERADDRMLIGSVVGIAGIALIATGAIKLAIHPSASSSAGVSLIVTPSGAALFARF